MSYPKSKQINAITYNDLTFLTNTFASGITSDNFDITTGKPINNIQNNVVDPFFINSISQSLGERVNINDNFIYKYPQILEVDANRDLTIAGETAIDVVFVSTGASIKNMFGYYFYSIDESGNKFLLDNDEAVEDYYYRPTVVFPAIYSKDNDNTTIQSGATRRLKGNLPNGNFQNIHVGFFLIPFGWFAFENNSTIDDTRILHSTLDFNNPCGNTVYQMLADKIYSVFAKTENDNGDELLLVCFEDIVFDTVDDLDYNDCVCGIIASHVENITNYDDFPKIVVDEPETTKNNIIRMNDNGECLDFSDIKKNISTRHDYYFERHYKFDNIDDRDDFYNAYINMLPNYKYSITKDYDGVFYKIISKHLFRKNDISKFVYNNSKKIYLLDMRYNDHLSNETENYIRIFTKIHRENSYRECYRLYETDTEHEIIQLSDNIDPPQKDYNDTFRIIGSGVMDCTTGKSTIPFKHSAIYHIYKNMSNNGKGLAINIKMDTHPTGYKSGEKYFVRYVSFVVDTDYHVIVDLGNLNIYQENNNSLVQINDITSLNTNYNGHINVGDVTAGSQKIKKLAAIFKNDSGALYRIININNIYNFYCIRLPRVKNNPSMIFLDTDFIPTWNEYTNNLGGTYYNTQKYYTVNTFKYIGSSEHGTKHSHKDEDD